MDRIHRADLQPLLDHRAGLCVSLFMPLTPAGRDSREDAVRLRDLVREAAEILAKRGMARAQATELLAPIATLPDDIAAWQHRGQSLAAFAAPGFLRVFHVASQFQAAVLVDRQFHIRPLLSVLAEVDRFFLLALSQNRVRLFAGDSDKLVEMALQGIPGNLEEAIGIEDAEHSKRYHSGMAGEAGKQRAIFHGQGGKPDTIKDDMRQFLRRVAPAIDKRLSGENAPLVLATVEGTVPLWREVSRYEFLPDMFVSGSPDHLTASELHAKVWPLVQPALSRRRELARQRLHEAAGSKVTFGLDKIVPAAKRAQIDSLFIDPTQTRWGRYRMEDESVEFHDQPKPGDEDLVELAAVETLKHKGDVFALDGSSGAAEALLRF